VLSGVDCAWGGIKSQPLPWHAHTNNAGIQVGPIHGRTFYPTCSKAPPYDASPRAPRAAWIPQAPRTVWIIPPRLFHPRPLAYLGLTTRPVTAPSVRSSALQQDPSPARHVRPDQPGRTRCLDHPTRPVHLRPMCLTGPYLLPDLSPRPLCGPRSSTRHPSPRTICRLDHSTGPVHPRSTGTCLSGHVLLPDLSPRPLCGRWPSQKISPPCSTVWIIPPDLFTRTPLARAYPGTYYYWTLHRALCAVVGPPTSSLPCV
jgi:hypothetical protein